MTLHITPSALNGCAIIAALPSVRDGAEAVIICQRKDETYITAIYRPEYSTTAWLNGRYDFDTIGDALRDAYARATGEEPRTLRELERQRDGIRKDRDAALALLNDMERQRDEMRKDRDFVLAQLFDARMERDAALALLNDTERQRDEAETLRSNHAFAATDARCERDAAIKDRDAALAALDEARKEREPAAYYAALLFGAHKDRDAARAALNDMERQRDAAIRDRAVEVRLRRDTQGQLVNLDSRLYEAINERDAACAALDEMRSAARTLLGTEG